MTYGDTQGEDKLSVLLVSLEDFCSYNLKTDKQINHEESRTSAWVLDLVRVQELH